MTNGERLAAFWTTGQESFQDHDSNEQEQQKEMIREGEREIAEGLWTAVESSSPLVIIALCTAIVGTVLGVVVTACYFNRKKTNQNDYTL